MKLVLGLLALALPVVLPGCGQAQTAAGPSPLTIERTIPLKGVAGRIDHLAVDLGHRRLFVAELGNGSVDAVDLDSGQSHRISGLKEPQGLGYIPDLDLLVVATGGDGTVRFYRGQSLAPAGAITLGRDADNVRIDAKARLVAVGYGSGAIGFIDAAHPSLASTIRLPVHPEGFQLKPDGVGVVVNLPDARSIAFAERTRATVTKRLPAAHAMNFPLALDPASGTIAIAYRWPSRLTTMDADTGSVRQDLRTCSDSDDVAFDTKRHRIYVVCGSGSVDVFQKGAAGYAHLASIGTRSGARTGLFVPELDRLYVAARSEGKAGAAILVLRP